MRKIIPHTPFRISLWPALLLLNLGGPLLLAALSLLTLPPLLNSWQEKQERQEHQKILEQFSRQAEDLLKLSKLDQLAEKCQLWVFNQRRVLFVSLRQNQKIVCQAGLHRSQRSQDIEFSTLQQNIPTSMSQEPHVQLHLEILRNRDVWAFTGLLNLGVIGLLLALSLGLALFAANSYLFFQLIHRPLKEFSRLVAQRNFAALAELDPQWGLLKLAEIEDFLTETKKVAREVLKAEQSRKNLAHQKALLEVAQQVSHDIQSPLSALNLVLHQLPQVSGEYQNLIRGTIKRIQQIVQDLAPKRLTEAQSHPPISIEPILKSLLLEKQTEYQHSQDLQLEFVDYSQGQAMVAAESSALSRITSNLINNSIEAGARQIQLAIKPLCSSVVIEVKDDGRGMPEDLKLQLGSRPVSLGKASGSGLGLYSTFKVIQSWGGNIEIDSQLDSGTSIRLIVPSACEPDSATQAQKSKERRPLKGVGYLEIYSGQPVTLSASSARLT